MKHLRRLRLMRGLSQTEFARRVGRSRVWCNYIERGHKRPSREFLQDAARVLKVPLAVLVGEQGLGVTVTPIQRF